jgi:hypothetical protein
MGRKALALHLKNIIVEPEPGHAHVYKCDRIGRPIQKFARSARRKLAAARTEVLHAPRPPAVGPPPPVRDADLSVEPGFDFPDGPAVDLGTFDLFEARKDLFENLALDSSALQPVDWDFIDVQ